ncbi:MAG: hypothetical protein HYX41_00075 [Bdellovibrio sp.]|nr:hypothetical protein [Bdellovibrio sp.]
MKFLRLAGFTLFLFSAVGCRPQSGDVGPSTIPQNQLPGSKGDPSKKTSKDRKTQDEDKDGKHKDDKHKDNDKDAKKDKGKDSKDDPEFGILGFYEVRQDFPHLAAIPPAVPSLDALKAEALVDTQDLVDRLIQKTISLGDKKGSINLGEDFMSAQTVSVLNEKGSYKVNLSYLSADPYLGLHKSDLNSQYRDDIDDPSLKKIFSHLKRLAPAFQGGGADDPEKSLDTIQATLTEPIGPDLTVADPVLRNKKMAQQKAANQQYRKRLLRAYDRAESLDAKNTDVPEEFEGLANSYVQIVALTLSQSSDKQCLDGLNSGMIEVERVFLEKPPGNLGDFISRVLADYRMEFIQTYASLKRKSDEIEMTQRQVLSLRMHASLGLRGELVDVQHAQVAELSHPLFTPKAVMTRFLSGDVVRLKTVKGTPTVTFQPYDVQLLVQLLQDSHRRGFVDKQGNKPKNQVARILSSALLNQLLQSEKELVDLYGNFLNYIALNHGKAQPDAPDADEDLAIKSGYFLPPNKGDNLANVRLSDSFWLYVLEKYGYIERNP